MLLVQAQQPKFKYVDSSMMEETVDEDQSDTTDIAEDNLSITADTLAHLYNLNLSSDSIEKWKNRKDYKTVHALEKKLKAWQQSERSKAAPRQSGFLLWLVNMLNSGLLQLILWCVAILFVVYIVRQLFLIKGNFKWTNNTDKQQPDVAEEKSLSVDDFDALINKAYKTEDYRIATRYLFLKTLQSLHSAGHIAVEADKTNSQYLGELPEKFKKDFARLIYFFEYTWYGINAPSRQTFDTMASSFDAFLVRQRQQNSF